MFRILILINSLSIHNKTFVYYPDFFPIPDLPMKPLYALCVPAYALILCTIVACGSGLSSTKSSVGSGDSISILAGTAQITDTETTLKKNYLIEFICNDSCKSCETCVRVSPEIEPDTTYNRILRAWIHKGIYDRFACESMDSASMNALSRRASFRKVLLLFYTEDGLKEISNCNVESYFLTDRRFGLLHELNDTITSHNAAVILMKIGEFEGTEALWDKADLRLLGGLKEYIARADTGNFYVYADLAAFFHVNKDSVQAARFLWKAKSSDPVNFPVLERLLQQSDTFDMVDYREAVYGGM